MISKKTDKKTSHESKATKRTKQMGSFWEQHWEIIITAILALIVGLFIVPKFFR